MNVNMSTRKIYAVQEIRYAHSRTNIYFWLKLNWDQRKIYVNPLVEKDDTKRQRNRTDDSKSRTQFSWIKYLKTKNWQKLRVCKKMFLNTLGINVNNEKDICVAFKTRNLSKEEYTMHEI